MRYLLLFICLISVIYAEETPPVPQGMQGAFERICRFPETRKFLAEVQKEGLISLKWSPLGRKDFSAFWMAHNRSIVLNASKQWSEGRMIASILFELHNAYANNRLLALDKKARRGELSRERYVEAVERVEYENVVHAHNLLENGIYLGYFPEDAHTNVFDNFADHFRLQQEAGHSAFIEHRYDLLIQNG